jgi:hypothetical protein
MNHLSKTQISMYLKCPFSYYCRYVMGIKKPPSASILMGKSFDTAVNLDYNNKIKTGRNEKASVVKDCFAEAFDADKGNTAFLADEKPEKLKDLGVKTIEVFQKEIGFAVKPTEVQVEDEITFENVDYTLKVVVDAIESNAVVIDNKYSGKSWSEGKEFKQLDPVIYSLWFLQRKKRPAAGFRFDIGIGTMTPKTQQIAFTVTDAEMTGFLKLLAAVNDSIESDKKRGVFYPRTDSFLCSRKFCGYCDMCSQEFGHIIL